MVRTKRLDVRIEIRRPGGQTDDLYVGGGERLAEGLSEPRVPIMDQEAFLCQKAIADIGQVASDLSHPSTVGLRRDARNEESTCGQVDKSTANRVSP